VELGPSPARLLEAIDISKVYGHVVALQHVDLHLLAGEIHGLVGDNGAGKSTLVKIISGALAPTGGELRIEGRPVEFAGPKAAMAAGIQTVYQNLALVGCRSITHNLFLGSEVSRFGFVRHKVMAEAADETLRALRQTNISDIEAVVEELSGGQRQAVAIARAVHRGGRIVLLDEPTAALGVRESEKTLQLIDEMRDPARAVLVISHNLTHVFRLADRITVLRKGRNVGTVVKARSNPDEIVRLITGSAEVEHGAYA
jgi:ABC-type sugar transport system ATPase subunit